MMNTLNEILQQAQARAQANGLPYDGALTPQEAFAVLQQNEDAQLVDVRSNAELDLVGFIPFAESVQWATYPGMVANPNFADELQAAADKTLPVIFMCRTGGRSHNAAVLAKQLGFSQVYNMLQGFEGEPNDHKQRSTINGWKAAGLPWSN